MVGDVQDVIATALGGDAVTTTVEGRERYTVNVRYPRDLRSDPQSIASDVLVPLLGGVTVPLGEVASVSLNRGPTTIRTEKEGRSLIRIHCRIEGGSDLLDGKRERYFMLLIEFNYRLIWCPIDHRSSSVLRGGRKCLKCAYSARQVIRRCMSIQC
jgi:hypothetical protein